MKIEDIPEAPPESKALVRTVKLPEPITHPAKPEVIHPYKGFRICFNANINNLPHRWMWWVANVDGMLVSWANSVQDGRRIVDLFVAAEGDLE